MSHANSWLCVAARFTMVLKCQIWPPAPQPLTAKHGMVTMLSTDSEAKEMQPMPHAKIARPIVITYLSLFLTLNCQNSSWGKFWDVSPAVVDPLAACRSAVAGDAFSMICVPANTTGFSRGNASVPAGGTPIHTVTSITGFAMGKFEVTFSEWSAIRTWALSNAYTIPNAGTQGGGAGVKTDQHPATSMDWRDMIVWCNAASEKAGLTPVYYTDATFTSPLRVSGGAVDITPGAQDNPYVKWPANGYRLATGAEWEYAARYIDGTTYLRGDAPSGWSDNNLANGLIDLAEKDLVAWTNNNSGGGTKPVGQLQPNSLGIYDMSGNVFELVFDWNGAYVTSSPYTNADSFGPATGASRDVRGGGYGGEFGVSNRGTTAPASPSVERGFRVVRRP
jgi:sulfatase modifying factor 1